MLPDILKKNIDKILCNAIDTDAAGLSLLLLDKDLLVIWANKTLSSIFNLNFDPVGKRCQEVYECECRDTQHCSILKALSSGSKQFSDIVLITKRGERKYIQNVSIPIKSEAGTIDYIARISIDKTEKEAKIHQLSLLQKLVELMQGTHQIDRLLHLILTCVTAGTALGFSRARLFLVDKKRSIVYGKMAVGPSSWEDAQEIWNEIVNKYEQLEDLIKASEDNYRNDTPLHMITRLMAYSLTDEKEIIVSCIKSKKPILEKNAFFNPDMNKNFVNMIGSNEFICVPLVVKDEAIGLICADNLYSNQPITDERVQLLSTFGSHAALAIENAETCRRLNENIQQLHEAQDSLIRSARLAVIGNMSSYIAHEIRNPLVTIGGFARILLQSYNDHQEVKERAEIIVEEVTRLEKFLANIMDFSKSPITSSKVETEINEILENTCSLMEPYLIGCHIRLTKKLNTDIPKTVVDPSQMKQVFLNLIKNASESMPEGGLLTIETMIEKEYIRINITDTGGGMDSETIQNIFVPFFTTKPDGTGVGLVISQKIIKDHDGRLKVESTLNEGTTFSLYLPIRNKDTV
ncbi:MAG: ATP-binding protein [Candidatus Brocadiaceae bacterium]|nr:ATP-binding protein [Candidatus Brocadiaceae bacterium]